MHDLLRGRVSRFSIDVLVNIATAIGCTVHFELQAARTPLLDDAHERESNTSVGRAALGEARPTEKVLTW